MNTNILAEKIENKIENKQIFNLPDWALTSELGLLTPKSSDHQEQTLIKRKKKTKRGFRR